MRNLLLLVLVLVGIWWVRRALNRPGGTDSSAGKQTGERKGVPERMVSCDHCGVHVPESEGVRDGDRFFCCEEHRRIGSGRQEP
ncbi:PP0621 family protein [Aromatoleum evansii]|uniref:PP0621 family protein n=1 Tax=Aromatoleum evansii TaxID=59406 RepID=UPI00145F0CBA|nr:hypothetical protein [Aromatoleum evansii]